MKIWENALRIAVAAANDSEVPLRFVGKKGVITDVLIDQERMSIDVGAGEVPFSIRHYGKVITKKDPKLEPGYNLVVESSGYRFLDADGHEVPVEVLTGQVDTRDQDALIEGCEIHDDYSLDSL